MAEITKKALVLTFATVGNKEVSLTIAKPNGSLVGTDIAAAMDRVVASNAYGDGDLVSQKLTAKYVMQQVENIALV